MRRVTSSPYCFISFGRETLRACFLSSRSRAPTLPILNLALNGLLSTRRRGMTVCIRALCSASSRT